jgi:CRISPR/Cas system-associated exonuclease Cas4 (RecB family)
MILHKSDISSLVCPLAGFRFIVEGVERKETPPMLLGTECHESRYGVLEGDISIEEALMVASDEAYDILTTTFESDIYLHEKTLNEKYLAVDVSGRYVECTKEEENDPSLQVLTGGTMDRIFLPQPDHPGSWREKNLTVEDYKTGRIMKPYRPEWLIYLLLAWAYCRHLGLPVETVRFVYFWGRTGKRTAIEWPNTFEALLSDVTEVISEAQKLLSKPYPLPGYHCTFCQFMGVDCPLSPVPVPAVAQGEQPPGRVGELLDNFATTGELSIENAPIVGLATTALDNKLKEIKAQLKPWIEEHGPIRVGDGQWTVRHQSGDSYDQESAIRLLLNDAPMEAALLALGVTRQSVARLAKQYPDWAAKINRYCRIRKPETKVIHWGRIKT